MHRHLVLLKPRGEKPHVKWKALLEWNPWKLQREAGRAFPVVAKHIFLHYGYSQQVIDAPHKMEMKVHADTPVSIVCADEQDEDSTSESCEKYMENEATSIKSDNRSR